MNKKWATSISSYFFFCLFSVLLILSGSITNITKADVNKLTKELLPKCRIIETKIINTDIQTTAKIFEACWNYNNLFPYIDKSIRLSRNSCYLENESNGIKNWIQVSVTKSEHLENGIIIIRANMDKGSVKTFMSEAILISIDNGKKTKVIFGINATMSGVPQFIMDDLIKSVNKKTIDNLSSRFPNKDITPQY